MCQDGLPWVGRPQKQTIWSRVADGSADQNYVLGGMYFHQREEAKSEPRIEGVAQMQFNGLPTSAGRGFVLESSHRALEHAPKKWLPPLPSYDGSPFFGECIVLDAHVLLLMTLTLRFFFFF